MRIDKQIASLKEQIGKLQQLKADTDAALDTIKDAVTISSGNELFLLNVGKLTLTFQSIELVGILTKLNDNLKKLERDRPGVVLDFEKISRDVNIGLNSLRNRADKMKSRADASIVPLIDDLLNRLNIESDQENKNDLFYQLSQLIAKIK